MKKSQIGDLMGFILFLLFLVFVVFLASLFGVFNDNEKKILSDTESSQIPIILNSFMIDKRFSFLDFKDGEDTSFLELMEFELYKLNEGKKTLLSNEDFFPDFVMALPFYNFKLELYIDDKLKYSHIFDFEKDKQNDFKDYFSSLNCVPVSKYGKKFSYSFYVSFFDSSGSVVFGRVVFSSLKYTERGFSYYLPFCILEEK